MSTPERGTSALHIDVRRGADGRTCGDRLCFAPHLRISEAAALLGVSDDTVRRMVDSGASTAAPMEAGRRTVDGAQAGRGRPGGRAEIGTIGGPRRATAVVTAVTKDKVMAQVERGAARSGSSRSCPASPSTISASRSGPSPSPPSRQPTSSWRSPHETGTPPRTQLSGIRHGRSRAGCVRKRAGGGQPDRHRARGCFLTESFDQPKADFEDSHPGITVEVSHGSSATLVQQVNQGAPAQVIALAGEAAAEPLDQSLVKRSSIFATNVLEIAVPPDNPGKVDDINDLGRAGLVVLCAETVPCGQAADATFQEGAIVPSGRLREVDVKATLAKVKLGEADAAVVYRSDVAAADGAATGVREPFNTVRYPIITLAEDAATAEFVTYALSAEGLAWCSRSARGAVTSRRRPAPPGGRMPLGGVRVALGVPAGLGLALLVLPLLALLLRADWCVGPQIPGPPHGPCGPARSDDNHHGGPLPPARDAARLAPRPERPPGGAMGAGAGHAARAAPGRGRRRPADDVGRMAWSAST